MVSLKAFVRADNQTGSVRSVIRPIVMSTRDFMLPNVVRQQQQQQQQQSSQTHLGNQPPDQQSLGNVGMNGYGLYANHRSASLQHSTLNPSLRPLTDGGINQLNEYGDNSDSYPLPMGYSSSSSQRDMAILSKGVGHMLPHALASHSLIDNVPVFDMSQDFPALGSTPTKSNPSMQHYPAQTTRAAQQQFNQPQPGFVVKNNDSEFPALGTSMGTSIDRFSTDNGRGSVYTAAAAAAASFSVPSSQSTASQPVRHISKSRFGLHGLLGVIRMTDPDRNTLALGTDLTTLGLNLNSTDVLYPVFASPWADAPSRREPEYILPYCYYRQPPALKTSHLSKFQLESLFYIFYNMPKDMLQVFAAKELYAREWKYHTELKLWFARPSDVAMAQLGYPAGTFVYFDTSTWERRVYPREHSDSLIFMTDEEITMM